jgi:hypothetical protein
VNHACAMQTQIDQPPERAGGRNRGYKPATHVGNGRARRPFAHLAPEPANAERRTPNAERRDMRPQPYPPPQPHRRKTLGTFHLSSKPNHSAELDTRASKPYLLRTIPILSTSWRLGRRQGRAVPRHDGSVRRCDDGSRAARGHPSTVREEPCLTSLLVCPLDRSR